MIELRAQIRSLKLSPWYKGRRESDKLAGASFQVDLLQGGNGAQTAGSPLIQLINVGDKGKDIYLKNVGSKRLRKQRRQLQRRKD